MAKGIYPVPFITETTEIFNVEASSPSEATMKATLAREAGAEPDHRRVTKFKLGTVKRAIVDPS